MSSRKTEFFDGFTSETVPNSLVATGPVGEALPLLQAKYTLSSTSPLTFTGTYYTLPLDTTEFEDSLYSNASGVITITEAGRYNINARAVIGTALLERIDGYIQIYKNGTTVAYSSPITSYMNLSDGDSFNVDNVLTLAANDTIQIRLQIDSHWGAGFDPVFSTDSYVIIKRDDGIKGDAGADAVEHTEQSVLTNLGINTGVSASTLTIALTTKDGSTNPSVGSPVDIGFRNASLLSAGYVVRSITAANSVTINSGATLGQLDGVQQKLYVYAIDNAGTVELAVSGSIFDETTLHTTVALSAASDSSGVLYSTTSRSNVAIRLIGHVVHTQVTAGTWASAGTEKYAGKIYNRTNKPCYLKDVKTANTNGGTITASVQNTRTINTLEGGNGFCSLTNGTTGTDGTANRFILQTGIYKIEVTAPALACEAHKLRLVEDPAGSPVVKIVGMSSYCPQGPFASTNAHLMGELVVTGATTFEVQHWLETNAGGSSNGLGAATLSGDIEVYTIVKIEKLLD